MPRLAGKHALLALLRQERGRHIFGNPGTTELSLMDALAVEDAPDYVLALHEGSAMGMAHGFAAASGELACVNLHAAPGLGNALGMLYNAKRAGAPVLVTAGTHRNDLNLSEPLLWDDLVSMARPLVKWAHEVRSLAELPRAVHRAVTVALAPPTGPVFLSIPDDVLTDEAELELGAPSRVELAIRPDDATLARAVELIASAERPLIFAGDIVDQRHAQAELAALAEAIGAPVHLEAMADTASFPTSHPLFAGLVPRLGTAVRQLTDAHDLILSVGGDLFTMSLPTGIEPFGPDTRIIHLDLNPWELGKNHPEALSLLADPKVTLPALTALVVERADSSAAAERVRSLSAEHEQRRADWRDKAKAAADAQPVAPVALLHALGQALPPDCIVVEEILSSNPGLRDLIRCDAQGSYYGMRGGGIGMAMPQAIGAKLAHPARPVLALIGDGSALYTVQSLWTAAHRRLPIPFVIFNNRGYRILKQRTKALAGHSAETGRYVAMDIVDPPIDYQALARSYGVAAVRCTAAGEAADAVRAALAADGPTLIEVEVAGGV